MLVSGSVISNAVLPCKTLGQKNQPVTKGRWSTGPNSEVMPARRRLNLDGDGLMDLLDVDADYFFIFFSYFLTWKSQSHCFHDVKATQKNVDKKIRDRFCISTHLFI